MNHRASVLLVSAALFVTAASAKVTEKFSQTHPLATNGTVALSNMNGNVEFFVWDRNEVSIEAEKSAKDEEALKRIEIIVEAEKDRLTIKTKHHKDEERSWWGRNNNVGAVHYIVRVPASLAHLKVDVMNSNVTAENIRGNVKIATMNGRIRATGLAADANLDTMNGRIFASFDKVGAGQKLSFDTMNGSCEVELPADASAHVTAGTMNGRVSCDIPMTIERAKRRSLRGNIGKGEATLALDSMNGSLTIRART
ncbi:MAG: hypothetical protein C0518_07390 [Opitutus sp.]|nr:hypothetical protein [Opitutus sp.]